MRASGNGDPQLCALNLLRTVRGEVPFARIKGLDARNIDAPETLAKSAIIADATWVIDTYEPRVNAREVVTAAVDAMEGDFMVTASVGEATGSVTVDE